MLWFSDSKLSSAGGEDGGAARRLDVIAGVFRAGLWLTDDLNSIWRVSFWRGWDFRQWREGCGRSGGAYAPPAAKAFWPGCEARNGMGASFKTCRTTANPGLTPKSPADN